TPGSTSRNSTTAARPSPSLPRRRRRSNGLWPGRNRSLSYISAQMQQVLVLNASYEPLNVTTVRRAHVLVYKGKAEVIQELVHPPQAPAPVLFIRLAAPRIPTAW